VSVWRYGDAIAEVAPEMRLTLGEGGTPLLRSRRLGPAAGLPNLYFKLETGNPTGSYKDRFAAVAVSDMRARGVDRCVATSSGNTGASLAAYCAAAGMPCEIVLVEQAPAGKVWQMIACGATLRRVRGFGSDPAITERVFGAVARLGARPGAAHQVSGFAVSPIGMTGVQTIGYELAEQAAALDRRLAHVFCPAGGGGLTLAVARAFALLRERGHLERVPRIECVQPIGNDTIAGPLASGEPRARPVACTTHISGLQVPTVLDGDEVIVACRATGGTGHLVPDEDVWQVQALLAREEGIGAEPAGAIATAAALRAAAAGMLDPDGLVVCLVTGAAFKDPASIDRLVRTAVLPLIEVGDVEALATV
jgi:threonine synthase